MADAPQLDATFFAFKRRDKRFVLTNASIAYFALALLLGGLYLAVTWRYWGGLLHWYISAVQGLASGEAPVGAPMADLVALAPWAFGYGLLGGVLFAAYEAACLRWLLRGESGGGLFGLRLSADTWRVFACYWVWAGLLVAVCAAIVLFYLGLRAIGELAGPLKLLVLFVAALTPLAAAALMIFIAVRLAPAAATSVARGRFAFFEAWSVTRGWFWQLLGAFIVLLAGYIAIATVAGQIAQMPLQQQMLPLTAAILSGGDVDRAFAALREGLLTPAFIAFALLYVVAMAILAAVLRVALFGVNARTVLAGAAASA